MKSLVLLSGGADSAVALALATRTESVSNPTDTELVHSIGFRYGQRNERELKAAVEVARHYSSPFHIVDLAKDVFSGPLVGEGNIPFGHLRDIRPLGISPVEVPFRNGVLLSMAVAYAVTTGCRYLWHGCHDEHGTRGAYPDSSPQFLESMEQSIWLGTGSRVMLISPFKQWTKARVIHEGITLHVPFHLTYSCYTGEEHPCGRCIACKARWEAFEEVRRSLGSLIGPSLPEEWR